LNAEPPPGIDEAHLPARQTKSGLAAVCACWALRARPLSELGTLTVPFVNSSMRRPRSSSARVVASHRVSIDRTTARSAHTLPKPRSNIRLSQARSGCLPSCPFRKSSSSRMAGEIVSRLVGLAKRELTLGIVGEVAEWSACRGDRQSPIRDAFAPMPIAPAVAPVSAVPTHPHHQRPRCVHPR